MVHIVPNHQEFTASIAHVISRVRASILRVLQVALQCTTDYLLSLWDMPDMRPFLLVIVRVLRHEETIVRSAEHQTFEDLKIALHSLPLTPDGLGIRFNGPAAKYLAWDTQAVTMHGNPSVPPAKWAFEELVLCREAAVRVQEVVVDFERHMTSRGGVSEISVRRASLFDDFWHSHCRSPLRRRSTSSKRRLDDERVFRLHLDLVADAAFVAWRGCIMYRVQCAVDEKREKSERSGASRHLDLATKGARTRIKRHSRDATDHERVQ